MRDGELIMPGVNSRSAKETRGVVTYRCLNVDDGDQLGKLMDEILAETGKPSFRTIYKPDAAWVIWASAQDSAASLRPGETVEEYVDRIFKPRQAEENLMPSAPLLVSARGGRGQVVASAVEMIDIMGPILLLYVKDREPNPQWMTGELLELTSPRR